MRHLTVVRGEGSAGAEAPASRTGAPSRGVYQSWWTIDGHHALYAITSRGERLPKIIVLRPGVNEADAILWLEMQLNRIDPPRPKFTVERGGAM